MTSLVVFLLGEGFLAALAWRQTRAPALRKGFWFALACLAASTVLAAPVFLGHAPIDVHMPFKAVFEPVAEIWLKPRY